MSYQPLETTLPNRMKLLAASQFRAPKCRRLACGPVVQLHVLMLTASHYKAHLLVGLIMVIPHKG